MTQQNKVHEELFIIFLKYPQPGKVKTRLAAELGEEKTIKLYRLFVERLLRRTGGLKQKTALCFCPADCKELFRDWLSPAYLYFPQGTGDLGKRMHLAFLEAFGRGYKRVVLAGSDIPALDSSLIEQGFSTLRETDSVLCPVKDGGYCLIGFTSKTYFPDVFKDISWSSSLVFQQSLEKIKQSQKTFQLLPQLEDVDTLEDLKEIFTELQKEEDSPLFRFLKDEVFVNNS